MVMQRIRRRIRRAVDTEALPLVDEAEVQSRPVSYPQRTIHLTVPTGQNHVTRTLAFAEELPWRRDLIGVTVVYAADDGQLLVRVNDAPPSSADDVVRGDVRVIAPRSFEEIAGTRIEYLGLRVQLDDTALTDTVANISILGVAPEDVGGSA